MPSSTSRWMSRSCSKASASMVTLTVPSMEFSMPTKPRSTVAGVGGGQHLGDRGHRHELLAGQVGLREQRLLGEGARGTEEADATARGRVRRRRSRGAMLLTWTKRPSRRLLDDVRVGRRAPGRRGRRAAPPAFADLGFARVDHHRALRQGLPEAVYGPGKTPEQCAAIVGELLDAGAAPGAAHPGRPTSRPPPPSPPTPAASGTAPRVVWRPAAPRPERVVVAAAGTADLPGGRRVRRHARRPTASSPIRLTDVGVAGVHRLLADGRRARRRRRRRRRRRHGGRAGQPRRRPHRRPRSSPCPPASATAPASRASPRCSPCSPRAPPGSPSSASTTASAPPAPSLRMLK